jgi:hypothetical protein
VAYPGGQSGSFHEMNPRAYPQSCRHRSRPNG